MAAANGAADGDTVRVTVTYEGTLIEDYGRAVEIRTKSGRYITFTKDRVDIEVINEKREHGMNARESDYWMRPSEVLERAADRVQALAAAASPAPWSAGDNGYGQYGDFGWYVSGPAGWPEFEDSETGLADARWVAALSPAVAPHLERWLRTEATAVTLQSHTAPRSPALAFAYALLGEEVPRPMAAQRGRLLGTERSDRRPS